MLGKVFAIQYSRGSNASIRERVAETALSEKIMGQKIKYAQKVAAREPDDPIRKCLFEGGSFLLKRTDTPRNADGREKPG